MFNVDDMVSAKTTLCSGVIPAGTTGVICYIENDGLTDTDWIGVRWDIEDAALHDCSGNCENRHGWYVYRDDIEFCTCVEHDFNPESFEILFDSEGHRQ